MESQQTLTLRPKKALRTSNDAIFPSLHPFGPYYRQKNLLQKRTSEMLDTEIENYDPIKKIHTVPQSVPYTSASYIPVPTKPTRPEFTNNIVNAFQYSQLDNQSLINGMEFGLANIWEKIVGANFGGNLQATLMMEIMRQQVELLTQQAGEKSFSAKVKGTENKLVISDSSTNESETEEESQCMKKNKEEERQGGVSIIITPLHQRQWNETNNKKEILPVEKTSIEKGGLDEISQVIQLVSEVMVEEDDGLMFGFTDKLKSPVMIGANIQAGLPSFRVGSSDEEKKKVIKAVWEPEEEKLEKAETLIDSLKELLGFEITNQEKAIKLLKDNDFVVEKCLEVVGKQKTKNKAEFKIKKLSLKKYR